MTAEKPVRCPDCRRTFPDPETAFQHVMAYGPSERRAKRRAA